MIKREIKTKKCKKITFIILANKLIDIRIARDVFSINTFLTILNPNSIIYRLNNKTPDQIISREFRVVMVNLIII